MKDQTQHHIGSFCSTMDLYNGMEFNAITAICDMCNVKDVLQNIGPKQRALNADEDPSAGNVQG